MLATALLTTAVLFGSQTQLQPEDVSRLAVEGWTAARAAAAKGGSPESLAPAQRALTALEKPVSGTTVRLEREYARSLIAAAMAASQDERPEMELHLAHARDISERLAAQSSHAAALPLPIDEAEGELWLEVDNYAIALKAYQRAAARPGATGALLGLARSAARLSNRPLACDSYRRWLQASPDGPQAQEARDYVARCSP